MSPPTGTGAPEAADATWLCGADSGPVSAAVLGPEVAGAGARTRTTTTAPRSATASATPAQRTARRSGKRIPGLVDGPAHFVQRHQPVALHGHGTRVQVHLDVPDAGQAQQLLGHRLDAVSTGHPGHAVRLGHGHREPPRIGGDRPPLPPPGGKKRNPGGARVLFPRGATSPPPAGPRPPPPP